MCLSNSFWGREWHVYKDKSDMETLVQPRSLKTSTEISFNWMQWLEYFVSLKYTANDMIKKSHIDRSKSKNVGFKKWNGKSVFMDSDTVIYYPVVITLFYSDWKEKIFFIFTFLLVDICKHCQGHWTFLWIQTNICYHQSIADDRTFCLILWNLFSTKSLVNR